MPERGKAGDDQERQRDGDQVLGHAGGHRQPQGVAECLPEPGIGQQQLVVLEPDELHRGQALDRVPLLERQVQREQGREQNEAQEQQEERADEYVRCVTYLETVPEARQWQVFSCRYARMLYNLLFTCARWVATQWI